MPLLGDRVQETTTTSGTGTFALNGAVTGYVTFNSTFSNGNVVWYVCDDGAGNWEIGYGTVGTGTLTRTVFQSSNSNNLVSFAAGAKRLFCTAPYTYLLPDQTSQDNKLLTTASGTPSWTSAINGITVGLSTAAAGTFTTLTATSDSSFTSTGALLISKGTTAQQPGTPVTGMIRYNTTTNQFEGYAGSSPSWLPVGGSVISNDTSTASNLYPIFANATSGTATTVYTSNANYLYKPSTGELQAQAVIAANGIFVNSATVAASYSIPSGSNATSAGPVSVASGITVTVPSGSTWVVV